MASLAAESKSSRIEENNLVHVLSQSSSASSQHICPSFARSNVCITSNQDVNKVVSSNRVIPDLRSLCWISYGPGQKKTVSAMGHVGLPYQGLGGFHLARHRRSSKNATGMKGRERLGRQSSLHPVHLRLWLCLCVSALLSVVVFSCTHR